MLRLTIIVAATKSNGIGQNGSLPWHLPKEAGYFSKVTRTAPEGKINAVVMGRSSWESIPKKYRPLPYRVNIVVSRNKDYVLNSPTGASVYLKDSLTSALKYLSPSEFGSKPLHKAFIIGGASLYAESLSQAIVDRVLMTRIISPDIRCDVFMPDFLNEAVEEGSSWKRAPHTELEAWVGFEVPEGIQEEHEVRYEFQMWTRDI